MHKLIDGRVATLRDWLVFHSLEIVHLQQMAEVAMWAFESTIFVQSESSHVVKRIPSQRATEQFAPPAKVDRACVGCAARSTRAGNMGQGRVYVEH